jgi:hypothetical protein
MDVKWGGWILIGCIAFGCSMLLTALILGSYSTYKVDHLASVTAPAAVTEAVIQKGTYEIQVQYYAPGNSITQFTVSAYVGSYVYSAMSNGYRVLTFSPFSYVFNKISAANQITFTLINPDPVISQLAGLQFTALVNAPFLVSVTSSSGTKIAGGTYPSVSVGVSATNLVVHAFPSIIASATTPLTIAIDKEIRFVAGIQS